MKMSEKIDRLSGAVQDVIKNIEGSEKSDSPLGEIYTVKLTDAFLLGLKKVLDETGTG